jgi:hypothetical protein
VTDTDSDTLPKTLDGRYLDSYCNTIDSAIDDLMHPITEFAENHPTGKAFDPATIPSETQREGFLLMRELLGNAMSLAGTLRYDISVDHADCPEHDQHMRRNIERIRREIGKRECRYQSICDS